MSAAKPRPSSGAPPAPAIAYGAKSSADPHGSIPTQLADCRAIAERLGFEVVAEYSDEAASAYSGNRGPGLAQAQAHAEQLAAERGTCALIVQHSDRLARGDGRGAKHLVEYVLWAIKTDVTLHSVQDPQSFGDGGDLLYAVVTGQRNHEDSKRKSAAVRDGLQRRKDSGQPVGPIPLGYTWTDKLDDSGQVQRDKNGKALTVRVIDPERSIVVQRIFDMVEAGQTFGDVARALNAAGLAGPRGATFSTRTVGGIVQNEAYTGPSGSTGYPVLIDKDRWQAIQDGLRRLSPSAVQRRKGGRPTATDDFLLRGIAFCGRCGHSLYTRRYAAGRAYLCGAVREARGTCDAVRIPAELAETQVLNHLSSFVGSVEDWLTEQSQARSVEHEGREAAVERARAQLAKLERRCERAARQHDELLDSEPDLAPTSLRTLQRAERERDQQAQALAEAEAVVSEWTGPPDIDAALDFYTRVTDLIHGKLETVGGADLNAALHSVLAGIWFDLEPDRDRLLAEFELNVPRGTERLPGGAEALPDGLLDQDGQPVHWQRRRPSLPPVRADIAMSIEPLSQASRAQDPARPARPAEPDTSPSCRSNR